MPSQQNLTCLQHVLKFKTLVENTTSSDESTGKTAASSRGTDPSPKECFCNLCRTVATVEFLYTVAAENIVQCRSCGLVFVSQRPATPGEAAGIYSQDYFEGGRPDGYTDYNASEETLRHQARRVLRRLRRYQPSGRLLELGCAYGFFLLEARQHFEVQGVEISPFAAEQARKRGLQVVAGEFQNIPFAAAGFSAVCLFDCIEHLVDPFEYLRKIHSVLERNGVVALTTGDIGSQYARWSGRKWRLMTPPQHLFFFSAKTLKEMLVRTGFEVLGISYPWKLVPWSLMLYQISPRLKTALGPLGRLPLAMYVNLFDAMFLIARKR